LPVPSLSDFLNQDLPFSVDGLTRSSHVLEGSSYLILNEGPKIHFWNTAAFKKSFTLNRTEALEPRYEYRLIFLVLFYALHSPTVCLTSSLQVADRILHTLSLQPQQPGPTKHRVTESKQRQLDRENHADSITDIKVSTTPLVVLTASRDGSIKVWR
jgi:WD40 repeat protein